MFSRPDLTTDVMKDATALSNPFDEMPGFECFACDPRHPTGLRLKFFKKENEVFCHFTARKEFGGFSNILHGGIQSTILDEVMWYAAFDAKKSLCLTQTMDVAFKSAVHVGSELTATARVMKDHGNSMDVEGELRVNGKITANAEGRYVFPPLRLIARSLGLRTQDLPPALTALAHKSRATQGR
jgi:acyl-coenzyme A thioesterase PaaI-like protein